MRRSLLLLVPLYFLFSCGGSTDKKKIDEFTPSGIDSVVDATDDASWPEVKFATRFTAMINTFGSQNLEELDKYISPEFGLLLIESERGAMPFFHIQKVDDESFRSGLEKICNNISFDRELKAEKLPKIDCDSKDLYSKSGSFVDDTNSLSGSEIFKYGNLSPEDQKFAERVINSIGKTVIITTGNTYYFTFYKDNWYLTIIDTRRPCEA